MGVSRMKTYPLHDDAGRVFAFEISNWRLGRRRACRIVRSVPGVVLTRVPKVFSWFREDSFCEFVVEGETFEVHEPFGDSSRYWIGPTNPRWLPQTERVLEAFARW